MEKLVYTERTTAKGGKTETARYGKALSKTLRILTVPPIMALFLVSALYIGMHERAFVSPSHYVEAVFALAVLPVVAYPVCAIFPSLRKKGRKMQRNMAIVFSLLGYVMGTLFAFLCGGTAVEKALYLTYLSSGAALGICTFLFGFKASGHACGAAGPFAMLSNQFSPYWLLGYLMIIPVVVSSIRLKRHTPAELIAGGLSSVVSYYIAAWILGII